MKHVLFVAFHYPPESSSSGVLRTLKYTRYLPENGWRPSVLTLRKDAYAISDRKLEEQIPPEATVVRTRYISTRRHLSLWGRYPSILAVPDPWIGWLPFAVSAAFRIARRDAFEVVYSTSPYATAHLIAYVLSKIWRKPWVADFRDPWYEEPPIDPPIVHWFSQPLERAVIRAAARVVTSTAELRNTLIARYPHEPPEKFTPILNGYDEADFVSFPSAAPTNHDRLLMLHVGSINLDFRDPRPLFAALRKVADRGEIDLDRIRLRFIGGGRFAESEEMHQSVTDFGLESVVEFLPRVPYDESLRQLSAADLLLLLQASNDTVGLVPAKLYEYLRAQKPILALVRTGAVTEVFAETGGGWITDPADAASLDVTLAEIVREWRDHRLVARCADLAALRRFDRRALTAELAAVFEEACLRNRA